MSPITRFKERLRQLLSGQSPSMRILRRRKLQATLHRRIPILQWSLLIAGYLWMLALPSSRLGRKVYFDENALQPSQVTTLWNWADVHRADQYLEQLEALEARRASSQERAEYLTNELKRLGLPSYTQSYLYDVTQPINGSNVYAVSSSPRASGTETIVISASWISRMDEGNGTPNLRGISTVLSLAGFLKGQSHWAKDFVFVIGDGYLDGMDAFLSAYHGKATANLYADPLLLSPGVIWTALNIDYPCHSFSHLGIFHEGLNGRLPNQDFINAFNAISRHTGGVPVLLYDHHDDQKHALTPTWLPGFIRNNQEVQEYFYRAKNIVRHVSYQASGKASGVHGLYHQYRIDAFTIFAISATGPHGFHALGRIVESTLRTANNLLERLHASFFFYILTTPHNFLSFGSFLPCVLLVSISLIIGGLHEYVSAGWAEDFTEEPKSSETISETSPPTKWIRVNRPALPVLLIMLWCHLAGGMFYFIVSTWPVSNVITMPFTIVAVTAVLLTAPRQLPGQASLWRLLRAFNLCFASTIISVTSLLNFSLAAAMAVLLGVPLTVGCINSKLQRGALLPLVWWAVHGSKVEELLWDWNVLGVWTAPFAYFVVLPLCFQAAIVGMSDI